MADLPSNNTYSNGSPSIPRINVPMIPQEPKLPAGFPTLANLFNNNTSNAPQTTEDRLAARGMSLSAPASSVINTNGAFTRTAAIPAGFQPVEAPPAPGNQPLPQSYLTLQQGIINPDTGKPNPGLVRSQTPEGFVWPKPNLDTTTLRTPPGIPGQYLTDSSQPGQIIKSGRSLTTNAKRALLDGRPSSLYQVDHIIPLWAGGADTEANYEVLPKFEHAKKTRAESVAWTLLANKKITPAEARLYVFTWKNRDLTDVPDPDQYGTIPVNTALAIRDKWKTQETAAPVVTFKDFLKAIPESGKEVGAWIDKNTESLPSVLQGMVKGFASGLTGGWVQYAPELNDRGGYETAGNIAGNIGGMLLPITAFSKAMGLAGGALQALKIGKSIEEAGIVGRTASQVAGGIAKTAGATGNVLNKVRVFRAGTDPMKVALAKVMTDNIIKYTPAFVAYGQTQATFNGADRGKQFLNDIIYGGLTGFFPPTLGGALKAGSTGLVTSLMLGDSTDERYLDDALINGAVVAALHGISSPGLVKEAQNMVKNNADQELTRAAHNVLHAYLPDEVPFLSQDSPVPSNLWTREQIVKMRQNAQKSLFKLAYGDADAKTITQNPSTMDMQSLVDKNRMLQAAGEWLEMRTLSPKEWDMRALQNYYSALQSSRSGTAVRAAPPFLKNIVNSVPDELMQNSMRSKDSAQTGNFPTGFMRTTGLAENFNPNPQNVAYFFGKKAKGEASPTLVAVTRPELAPHLRNISDDPAYTWTDSNPNNTVHIFGITKEADGARQAVDLGFWPQGNRIEGGKFSFNSQPEIQNGTFKKYPTNLDKDTVADRMNSEGINYLFLNFDDGNSGFLGGEKGNWATGDKNKPFVSFTLNDENWGRSIAAQNSGRAIEPSQQTLPELLKDVKNSLNTKKTQESIAEVRNRVQEPASQVLLTQESDSIAAKSPDSFAALHDVLDTGSNALSQQTPQAMKAELEKYFGIQLDDQKLLDVFNRRNDMTVRELIQLIKSNGSPEVNILFNATIDPLYKSTLFKNGWVYGQTFDNMRVVGTVKNEPAVAEASVSKTLPTTPTDIPATETPAAVVKTVSENSTPTPPTVSTPTQIAQNAPTKAFNPVVDKLIAQVKKSGFIPNNAQKKVTVSSGVPRSPAMKATQEPLVSQSLPAPRRTMAQGATKVFLDAADELENRARDIMDSRVVGKTREDYTSILANIIKTVDPYTKVPGIKGAVRELNTSEKNAINKTVKPRIREYAEQLVENAFNPDNEIAFKTGSAEDKELHGVMVDLIKADTRKRLGDPGSAADLLNLHPLEQVERAADILGMKQTLSVLKPSEVSKGPTGKFSDEEFAVLNHAREKAGKDIVRKMEEAIKNDGEGEMGEYTFALAQTQKALAKQMGLNLKNPRDLQTLGAAIEPFSPRGSSKEIASLYQTEKGTSYLQPITHSRDYLEKLGNRDVAGIMNSSQKRSEDWNAAIDNIGKSEKPQDLLKLEDAKVGAGNAGEMVGISAEDPGRLRLESPTQEQNVEAEKVWTELYPGLHSAMLKDETPGIKEGVRDGMAQMLRVMRLKNKRTSTSRNQYGGKGQFLSLNLMEKGSTRGAGNYKEENQKRTKELIDSIANAITKELTLVRSRKGK